MDVSEKKLRRKTLAQDVFWQMKSWWGKDAVQNISVRSLTLFILPAVVVATTRTRVSDATAVTSSVKCFDPLKLYPLWWNIFRNWFASFLFIHEQLIIMWSCCWNDTFT